MMTAMLCAAAVSAQFVSGKATRDALFLTSLDFSALPNMLIATSVVSILLVAANVRAARSIRPEVLVPASFVASAILFICEWLFRSMAPSVGAVVVYLHISAAGPLLASGFWLISSERFDPHTAKKRFGQIAGAGTLGGLVSALVAERIATLFGIPAMLPLLAALQLLSAWMVRRLAVGSIAPRVRAADLARIEPAAPRAGLRLLAETPYLRHLAALVLLGTTGAALIDYLFKANAVQAFGRGDHLLRFFAIYYAGTSLLTFIVQTSSSSTVLARFGLAFTTSTPSIALLAGSISSLLAPGFGTVLVARGGESVLRSSLFRAGYELFYTPIPASEKRAAKSIIDVAFDRLGDAVGGMLVRLTILLAPALQSSVILSLGMACSAAAIFAASRLNRGYVRTLERSLLNRAGRVDLSDLDDATVGVTMRKALGQERADAGIRHTDATGQERDAAARQMPMDREVQDILALRSRDRERVVRVLSREDGIPASLVPHAIALLAWDAVAEHALFALRKVAEERVGELADALVDPNQEFAIRRRLARVFSVCVSQRAADGVALGLDDIRFDVRYQSARSLLAIVEKNPSIRLDGDRMLAVALREVTVGRPVWESRRLLDGDAGDSHSPLDRFVRDRAGDSLAHVFTLLSLVMPREPMQIAFRSLHTDDPHLQGTAIEYLEEVLPLQIRERLWPYIERRPVTRTARPTSEVIAELLRSNHTIAVNLRELQRRAAFVPLDTGV
jgi:hypothetical protein